MHARHSAPVNSPSACYIMSENKTPTFFVNSRGEKVYTFPVHLPDTVKLRADIERRYRERGEMLDAPKYYITVKLDEAEFQEEHTHTPGTLQTPEDLANWETYNATWQRLFAEMREKELYLFIMRGIDWEKHPIPDSWKRSREKLGFIVPAEEDALRLDYASDRLVVSVMDVERIKEACTRQYYEGAPEEVVNAVVDSLFRRSMEKGKPGNDAEKSGRGRKSKGRMGA